MQDTRTRTLDAVSDLQDAEVDARVAGFDNTIGATLYHIAAIEADWLYNDILLEDYPGWLEELFPHDVREEDGRLSPVDGFSAANHLERLATVRAPTRSGASRPDPIDSLGAGSRLVGRFSKPVAGLEGPGYPIALLAPELLTGSRQAFAGSVDDVNRAGIRETG